MLNMLELGSTAPFLNDKFQDLRFVVTDRDLHGSPVWAAVSGELFMYGTLRNGWIAIGDAAQYERADMPCQPSHLGYICNIKAAEGVPFLTPTDLPSASWWSAPQATMEAQYASAKSCGSCGYVWAPTIRITAVHGLDSDDPAMVTALRQLATLA